MAAQFPLRRKMSDAKDEVQGGADRRQRSLLLPVSSSGRAKQAH
jgi:hypothetical protein